MFGIQHHVLRLLFMVAVILGWEFLARFFEVPAFILPTPSAIAVALVRGVQSGLYISNAWVTLAETFLGFLLGVFLALSLGTVVALSRRTEFYLYPFIVMFQSMPKVALAPIVVIWFGLGMTSKVVSAALVAFFPLMVNTIAGLRSTDPDRLSLMKSLNASPLQIFTMLQFPNALPYIMAGIEVAMIFSLIGAIVAEFVGAEAGLGMLIQSMNLSLDVAGQFSILIILSFFGLGFSVVLRLLKKKMLFWDASSRSEKKGGEVA